jgi:hypothetical protein
MRRRGLGAWLSALLAISASISVRAAVESGDLDELMQLLAMRRHGQVSFVEQHFLALLKRPVESYGELIYDAPGRLEKRTVEPRAESLVLVGDVLTVERGKHIHVVDLKSYPTVLPLIESLRATLAGDLPALERVFDVNYSGDLSHWVLSLVPREDRAAKDIARVRIEGIRDNLLRVEIFEADGDRSLMTLRAHPTP